jgi:hypothetical protein
MEAMNKPLFSISIIVVILAIITLRPTAQEGVKPNGAPRVAEYATVRFAEERTSIVWPDGSVEKIMELIPQKKFNNGSERYPKDADYRMYWMTMAMNHMAQRGFEIVSLNDRDLVMKRSLRSPAGSGN